jgi:propionate CoA-transferase
VDLENDILAHIGFEPIIMGERRLMDARIFADGLMGLTADLLTVPLEARFVSMAALDEVESLGTEIEKRLAAIGKRVQMVVNHDNFYLAPVPADAAGWRGSTACA